MFDQKFVKDTILKDYDKAVLILLWCIDSKRERKLIFSSFEFYPRECAVPETAEEHTIQVKITKENKVRLFYRCITLTAYNALKLYLECKEKQSFTMIWENEKSSDGMTKRITTTPLVMLPAWPAFSITKQEDAELTLSPFLPDKWGACRMSHLLTTDPDPLLITLLEHEKPVQWIKERLLWNINEYPELIGSMHMVLPNPIYRYMEERLIPGKGSEPDKVRIYLAMREGQVVTENSKLMTIERSYIGLHNGQQTSLSGNYAMINLAGKAEEFSTLFYCPLRGVLDYTKFASFLQSIQIDLRIKDAVRIVKMPDTGETYTVQVESHDTPIVIGRFDKEDMPEIELGKKIGYHVRKHKAAKEAAIAGQKLFENNSEEKARDYIRELIQHARKKVIIVDPYFSTIDFYKYVCAISSRSVDITILTSSLMLKAKSDLLNFNQTENQSTIDETITQNGISKNSDMTDNTDCYVNRPEKGEELLQQIKTYGKQLNDNKISVSVMTGDQPLIHDRFLVIDDDVWFSGNSLNHLGERASMLIRLQDPTDVLRLITAVLGNKERVKPLDVWVAERKAAINKEITNCGKKNGEATE